MIDFNRYHKENPHIWKEFVDIARQTKAKGFDHYSANGIFEIIRWHTGLEGNDRFKVNNIYRPDYARKMMDEYPEFKGFFRVRETKQIRTKS